MMETMLYCFIIDEEMFNGRQRYAEKFIKDYMNSIGKESDQKLEKAIYKTDPFANEETQN